MNLIHFTFKLMLKVQSSKVSLLFIGLHCFEYFIPKTLAAKQAPLVHRTKSFHLFAKEKNPYLVASFATRLLHLSGAGRLKKHPPGGSGGAVRGHYRRGATQWAGEGSWQGSGVNNPPKLGHEISWFSLPRGLMWRIIHYLSNRVVWGVQAGAELWELPYCWTVGW